MMMLNIACCTIEMISDSASLVWLVWCPCSAKTPVFALPYELDSVIMGVVGVHGYKHFELCDMNSHVHQETLTSCQ